MTQPPNSQSPNLPTSQITNPYVGPRTFAYEQRHLFFGREREARDLLARVLSERLLLFYAQSGAGKSSLLRTRLIPQLQEEKGFVVLPVGRVSGELPAGVGQVDNIFVFNLLLSMDEGGDPARLAHVTLADFLARLTRQSVPDLEGRERKGWVYDADATPAPAAAGSRRYALIVDQFEEIVTSHPGRWREREDFFRQLDAAMRADPNLWVVLTLREDYVAALDPYAPFVADRLRARFYMERMGKDAALDAIRHPAELGGRPFAPGVAEKLADDLRQVRVPGQEATIAGQYVEPVQLQVVCYQLWEGLREAEIGERRPETGDWGGERSSKAAAGERRAITFEDLARAGDVDRALTQFYEETLAAALADPAAAGVSERQLRAWFDGDLITETGTRGLVHQGESDAGGLPNGVVRALQRRFLVRTEARGGDTWIELVHDRFVEPIRASNAAWFPQHLSALQRQAALWDEQGRSDGLLLSGKALAAAEGWAAGQTDLLELEAVEQEFLSACRRAQAVAERERSVTRRYSIVGVVMMVFFLLFISFSNLEDKANATLAEERAAVAEARLVQAGQSLRILDIEQLLSMAGGLDEGGDARGATALVQTAVVLNPTLLDAGNLDRLSVKSLSLLKSYVPIGRNGYQYVFIPNGTFVMGSDADAEDEAPRNSVYLPGYWIGRTEVTNDQYAVFVEATGHPAPANWEGGEAPPGKEDHPVVNVSWDDAVAYTAWLSIETGQAFRLPTEAEWEKACRGANGFIYPWGFSFDANKANTADGSAGTTTSVGRYSSAGRDSPYGVADMAGNVSEWTSSQYERYPYDANDGREDLMNHSPRVLRGGSFVNYQFKVRCAVRTGRNPEDTFNDLGFRVAWASPGP